MTKIAINVVLLPDEEMANSIIKINKELLKVHENKIVLEKVVNQPHISLCMGGINEVEFPQIIKIIDEISNEFTRFDFKGKLNIQNISENEKITWLKIKKSKKIQEIHEALMNRLWKYLSYTIKNDMLSDSKEVEEKTLSWIKFYSTLYENPSLFNPHITIGVGNTVKNDRTFEFSSSEIAIFKLGNYCTCRKLIYKSSLN